MDKIKPKMKIDNEYSTSFVKENQYLLDCGLKYAFVKVDNGVTIWKYKKTPMLFEALKIFYMNNKFYDAYWKQNDENGTEK